MLAHRERRERRWLVLECGDERGERASRARAVAAHARRQRGTRAAPRGPPPRYARRGVDFCADFGQNLIYKIKAIMYKIMNALCVVGEWRTFAMPAVFTSILDASRVWNADTFLFYHTRYDATAMKHPHREGASACAFNSTILAPFTVAKEVPSYSCDKTQKASIQFLQITSCFNHALEHEIVQHRRYNWIIRTRPDYLIYNPLPLPFDENSQILVSYPKPDILFAVPRRLTGVWFSGMSHDCVDDCCLEYTHEMFKSNATKVWEQDGAIVRDVNKLTHKTDGVKFVNGLECNITHVPA